jgi:Ala-tRNA(Pro) deacylase
MTHTAARSLAHELLRKKIPFVLIPHARTDSALAEADALHVDPREVAKTIVLTTSEAFVLAVLPASRRIDLHKLRELLDDSHVALASEETLAGAYPDFELGALPPVKPRPGDRVLVDRRLCENEFVLFEAGTHDESVRLKTSDLLLLAGAELTDICRTE